MKKLRILLISLCLIAAMSLCFAACGEDGPKTEKPEYGSITGTVKDEDGEPIDGAEVFYTDADSEEDDENSVEADEDGKYEIKRVKLGEVTLRAVSGGYADGEKQLTADDFDADGAAVANFVLAEGKGVVKGTVSMDNYTTKKIAGATVSIGSLTTTTDANGQFEIKDVAMLGSKSLNVRCEGFESTTKTITSRSYVNGVATIPVTLVQNDLPEFPGIKPYQLETLTALDKASYSASEISSLFKSSPNNLVGMSKVESHSEGYCINANTMESRQDSDHMAAFVFAKLKVTQSTQFLTAYARMFRGQNGGDTIDEDTDEWIHPELAVYARLGLYLFEEGEGGTYTLKKEADGFGHFTEVNTESYKPITFDLSSEAGKTVVFVLGVKTGYHCCLSRVEFDAEAPDYLNVKDVDGLTELRNYAKVTDSTFNASALKEKWATGGGTSLVDEGIQLNGTDPWKAEDYTPANPQPVNSYMYIRTDLTEAKAHMTVRATIVRLDDTYDRDDKYAPNYPQFLPYFCVIVLDSEGNNVYQSAWTKLEVSENKEEKVFDFDLSGHTGNDMTVIIAANVGYRATITGVSFDAAAASGSTAVQPALLPAKRDN